MYRNIISAEFSKIDFFYGTWGLPFAARKCMMSFLRCLEYDAICFNTIRHIMAKKKEIKWEPDDFELETNTVWSFPNRGKWATHDAKYRGNWSPYIPRSRKISLSSHPTPLFPNEEQLPTLRPFVKWAGGKSQLLSEIRQIYPAELGTTIKKYAEPFVGGGAVLFDLLSSYTLDAIYISDINADLINTYCMVKENIEDLLAALREMQECFIPKSHEDRRAYYASARARFNDLKINGHASVHVEKAALFIFLNRTCFNGLYRVNRKRLFNVPMGAYKNPLICDENNLRAVSRALQKVSIVYADYRQSVDFIDSRTLVYFDPPYRPLTATANFTAYTETLFDDDSQKELAEYVGQLSQKKARIIVSNSDPKNSDADDDFFDVLYEDYQTQRVEASRMINCNGESRGKISELLIKNY